MNTPLPAAVVTRLTSSDETWCYVAGMADKVEKVLTLGIKRELGYFYFVGDGKLYRTRMIPAVNRAVAVEKRELGPEDLVADLKLPHDHDYNYFLDSKGDISRAPKQDWEKQPCPVCARSVDDSDRAE